MQTGRSSESTMLIALLQEVIQKQVQEIVSLQQ